MKKEVMKRIINQLAIVIIALGLIVVFGNSVKAEVITSNDDYTLYSDGTLEITCNEGVFQKLGSNEWDDSLKEYVPIVNDLYQRVSFKSEYEYSPGYPTTLELQFERLSGQ